MLTYLDLFAGAGGVSLGLKAAGFSCVGVAEMDNRAAASYRLLWIGVCVRLGYLIKVSPQIGDPNPIYPGDTVISQLSCSTRS
jgi:hypothetical protein